MKCIWIDTEMDIAIVDILLHTLIHGGEEG
jgi:hypothetical protein